MNEFLIAKAALEYERRRRSMQQEQDKLRTSDIETLYKFQSAVLKTLARFNIYVKARQIGFSFLWAYLAVKQALFEATNTLIVSASYRQANRVMYYAEQFIREYREKKISINLITDNKTEKQFTNGAQILSLPPNPETIRGFPGNVLLDEFALYKNDKEVFEAILPSITGGHGNKTYNLTISSTPLGLNNKFYEIYSDTKKYPGFNRASLNIYEAIKQSEGKFTPDIELIKENYDEDSFRQEYLCEFIDDATSYFTYELIRSCISKIELQGAHFLGIDIGRTKDRTVIADVIESGGQYLLTRLDVMANTDFQTQKANIKQIYHETNAQHIIIDKGAIGYQLAEELHDEINAEGIMMTNPVKVEIVTLTKKHMENKTFHISENIPENETRNLITDFHSINKNITSNNLVQFNSPRDETGHGDRAWAVMLAMKAADAPISKISF